MIQLRALNDVDTLEENSIYSESDNYKVTGEAEETIVISEYVRALKLKDAKQHKAALSLFLELLGTDVLNKVDSKNDQLLLVKYNCYRNVGFILKERGQKEMAMYYLLKATEMNSSDVHTFFFLGRLSQSLGRKQIAAVCYEKCMEYNLNHWPSKEGLLNILCTTNNVIDAYFWARHCLEQDSTYAKAIDVLVKIRCHFPSCLKFLENIFGAILDGIPNRLNFFSGYELPYECVEETNINDFVAFKANNLDWITLGKLILNLQDNMLVSYKVEKNIDITAIETEFDTVDGASAQNEVQSTRLENEISGFQEDSDAKYKRRDTELKILEQWGWHKSKRPLRKKNSHDADPNDSTADGFIRRTLAPHFLVCYESDISPFSGNKYDVGNEKSYARIIISLTVFSEISKIKLKSLIYDLKELNDSYTMAVCYTYHLSKLWNEALPEEICIMYRHIYQRFYLNENYHSWFHLSSANVVSQIQITMFYLELEYDFMSTTDSFKSVSGETYRKVLCSLELHISLIESTLENYVMLRSRYLWLNYITSINEDDLYTAATKLQQLLLFISEQNDETFAVSLPSVSFTNYFDLQSVKAHMESLELRINMQNIQSLYETCEYEEIIQILTKCLKQPCESQLYYKHPLDKHAQMELLLESLWMLEKFQDCMSWAEKVLKYSTDNYFVQSKSDSYRIQFAKSINSALLYIHELIEILGCHIIEFEFVSRMIQTIHKILTSVLDAPFDKNVSNNHVIDCWRAWIILHYILEWENDRSVINRKNFLNHESKVQLESEEEKWLSSTMMFFVAHELLGRRQWCSKGNHKFLFMILNVIVPKLHSPLFQPYRDFIQEGLEQTTYCLYGYPYKKARNRHILEHGSNSLNLSWPAAGQLLEIFRPQVLPEFNSYKIDSISADMETLLQQCISTMAKKSNIVVNSELIDDFINGKTSILPLKFTNDVLPFKMNWIYYLLADYYFKCRDFSKAIQYYKMDLTVDPTRFDSWAGISLSKASKCETMIGSLDVLIPTEFLKITDDTLKCFEMCLKFNENDPQLWVENGSFAYNIQSYCSRYRKCKLASSKELSYVKLQQNKYTKIVHKCFNKAINHTLCKEKWSEADYDDRDDEQWLYHYMLGKIFEKDRGNPVVYLTHYFKSSLCLYESNATYPIKISHSNPSQLSIESLELFYRTNAAIIKYMERNTNIRHSIGLMFMKILKELAVCPFAVNRAKINEVLLKKHKFSEEQSMHTSDTMKIISQVVPQEAAAANSINTNSSTSNTSNSTSSDTDTIQEMSSDSDSNGTNINEKFIDLELKDAILKECLKNLEECATRFPEHYKSLYRLAYHYLYSTGITKSVDKCYELLLGSYKTELGAQVQGLFTEKRSNNFFNGIWRIPSSDIDRPGSFETHLCKCITLLINVLIAKQDHETILELAVNLYKTPETDKKYLYEKHRELLYQTSVSSCLEVLKDKLARVSVENDDCKLLSLMIDIFKVYRKSVRHIQEKERDFSSVLVDAYIIYIKGKATLPANANSLDLALKLCAYEINYRKMKERMDNDSKQIDATSSFASQLQPVSSYFVPGLTKQKKVAVSHFSINTSSSTTDRAIRCNFPPFKTDLSKAHGQMLTDLKAKNLSQSVFNITKENSDLTGICKF